MDHEESYGKLERVIYDILTIRHCLLKIMKFLTRIKTVSKAERGSVLSPLRCNLVFNNHVDRMRGDGTLVLGYVNQWLGCNGLRISASKTKAIKLKGRLAANRLRVIKICN